MNTLNRQSTLVGLIMGVAAVLLLLVFEGGNLLSFLNAGALVLILGGSVAVSITSFGLKEVFAMPAYFKTALAPPGVDLKAEIVTLLSFSEKARREGLLSLEDDMESVKDEMTRKAMQMVIDGTEPENILTVLEDFSESTKKHAKIPAEIFETLGGFSPTLGIIGTVMGLVHVLEGLGGGGGIQQLGEGIAVAFIATFYGIGFANLLWLPLSNKIKWIIHHEESRRQIITSGVLGIQSGDNPRVLKDKLIALIGDPVERKKIEAEVNL